MATKADALGSLNYYELLEVPATATRAQIKKAYRVKALQYHPDKNKGNAKAAQLFLEVHKAKEVLLDEPARKAYDDVIRAKEARKQREREMDSSRKRMADTLLEREQASKKRRVEEEQAKQRLEAEIARLRREGYAKMKKQEEEAKRAAAAVLASTPKPEPEIPVKKVDSLAEHLQYEEDVLTRLRAAAAKQKEAKEAAAKLQEHTQEQPNARPCEPPAS